MLKLLLGFLRDRDRGDRSPAVPRRIDPNEIFPDDGRWDGSGVEAAPVTWRIRTPQGDIEADGCSVEIVEGALHVLNGTDDVLLALPAHAWERVEAAAGRDLDAGGVRPAAAAGDAPRVKEAA